MESYLDSNHLSCDKKTGSPHLALVALTAGGLADEIGLDFESLKSSTDWLYLVCI